MDGNFPTQLKELRKAYGYTQDYVAACLGIARQTYSHYENGRRKPDYDVAVKLSELYEKPAEMLFSADGDGTTAEGAGDFLDWCNSPHNQLKLKFLDAPERELLYYFNRTPGGRRIELLEIAEILSRNRDVEARNRDGFVWL